MAKSTKYKFLAIFLAFVGMITLGELGNAAVESDAFYWFPFVFNLGLYAYAVYKLFKKGQED